MSDAMTQEQLERRIENRLALIRDYGCPTLRHKEEFELLSDCLDFFAGRRLVQAGECIWSEASNYGDTWESSCGSMFTFTDDGPKENNMQFCNNCGGKVVVNDNDI